MTSGFIRGAAKALAKNGKNAAKAVVKNGSNGNGAIKNGAEALTEGNLAKQAFVDKHKIKLKACLLYTSPSPRDVEESRMPSSA